jgi:hypothetical protein
MIAEIEMERLRASEGIDDFGAADQVVREVATQPDLHLRDATVVGELDGDHRARILDGESIVVAPVVIRIVDADHAERLFARADPGGLPAGIHHVAGGESADGRAHIGRRGRVADSDEGTLVAEGVLQHDRASGDRAQRLDDLCFAVAGAGRFDDGVSNVLVRVQTYDRCRHRAVRARLSFAELPQLICLTALSVDELGRRQRGTGRLG